MFIFELKFSQHLILDSGISPKKTKLTLKGGAVVDPESGRPVIYRYHSIIV